MAVDEDGGTFVIWDYEICDYSEETIKIREANLDEDSPDMEFVNIYIGNDTVPIHFIFISPGDSEMWGVDYLDMDTILTSVRKTGNVLVVHESPGQAGIGTEIARRITEAAFDYLDSPPTVHAGADLPIPFSPALEPRCLPQVETIVQAVRDLLGR